LPGSNKIWNMGQKLFGVSILEAAKTAPVGPLPALPARRPQGAPQNQLNTFVDFTTEMFIIEL